MNFNSYVPPILFLLFDYAGVVLSEHLAFILRDWLDTWNRVTYIYSDSYIYGAVPLLFLIFLGQSRTYRQMKPVVDTMRDIFKSVFAGWIASIIIIYFLKASQQSSRLFIILFGLFVLINVCVIRYVVLKILKRRNIFCEPIILIGAGLTAERLIKFWQEDLGYRYKIVGLIDDKPVSKTLPKNIRAAQVKTVIIAAPGLGKEKLQELISKIQPYVKNISFIPDLIGTPMSSAELSILFSEKILMLNLRNNLSRPYNRAIKRIFDLTLTICGGLMISPVLLIIAILVGIDNRGRIIFAHKRVGAAGKKFPCYKFQTMIPNADVALKKYPRILYGAAGYNGYVASQRA